MFWMSTQEVQLQIFAKNNRYKNVLYAAPISSENSILNRIKTSEFNKAKEIII